MDGNVSSRCKLLEQVSPFNQIEDESKQSFPEWKVLKSEHDIKEEVRSLPGMRVQHKVS